jgi:hypothetical protein
VFGRNCGALLAGRLSALPRTVSNTRTLRDGKGDDKWKVNGGDADAGAVVEMGEACDMRCSASPSSIAVMGVGMSLAGSSMSAPEGLPCESDGDGACAGESCGGGVGSCMGTSGAASP